MKFTKITFLIMIASCIAWVNNLAAQTTTNLALEATVTTSFVSPWESLEAVKDGVDPTSSTKTTTAYGNWNGDGDYGIYNWVQYEWENAVQVSSTSIYWWDDNPGDVGIAQPTEAYIEYWNGLEWVNAGDIGTNLDMYNKLEMGDVWTQKIKVTMKSPAATGILEWKVMGQTGGDDCEATVFDTYIKVNDAEALKGNSISILVGDNLVLSADEQEAGEYFWSGPNELSTTGNEVSFTDMQANQSGTYNIKLINDCGKISESAITITVSLSNDGSAYSWPSYEPTIYYDFRDEYPALEMPTKDLDDCANVAGRKSSEWWTFVWGPNRRQDVTDVAIDNMLERFNKDFAYFRDTMGWPPDKRAKNGYRSAIYLFGSGMCVDGPDTDTTTLGGWQGSINYQGENWPMVLASYFPVRSFDPKYKDDYQTGAMIHEGIHALLADLPGARNSAWFHEGGNTWLQQEMESRKSGDYSSMGFLNVGALIAPFMPIECYSGWLQDETFGGPSAEGVNMFEGNQQICTWKNLLGGNQYGNMFPVIFSQIFGDHSVAWIWRYCENRVLEGIADTLGDYQMRRVIMEYRAKQAMLDIGKWSEASRKLIDANFGVGIRAEWQPSWKNPPTWYATPYVITSEDENRVLTPEYRTTPGWSGANQIPLIANGDTVTVDFQPIGKNMSCQLCYRATDGSIVYGEPVLGGECKLALDKQPANDVVIAVICNTDYIYEGEQTRTAHFDYRLKLVDGIEKRGSWKAKWYQWDNNIYNPPLPTTTANFIADATSIDKGSNVEFSDRSSNVVRGYHWDFGDGTTSTEKNPVHAYDTTGTFTVTLTVQGTNGDVIKTKADYITVTSPTGIIDLESDDRILLFPNPAKSTCTIQLPEEMNGEAEVKIFNTSGKELRITTNQVEKSFEIDLSPFSPGLYFVAVITEEQSVTKKLIIAK
ncbi:T9SS type A sorting domain-containing protein [Maribellus mangrovi]|uniref:T9SS type A sorting domain-containing protein n=1 Tax=Maribellus mangrovi TaxID=3133146 RepID=UPI0030EC3CAD